MDRRSTALGQFSIHPETGELSVAAPLDRETQPRYNLIVQAYDNHQFGFSTGDSRHAFVQVAVTVSDVNDESPVFVRDVVSGQQRGRDETISDCSVVVTEFHERTEPVLTVVATDADDPNTDNGKMGEGWPS